MSARADNLLPCDGIVRLHEDALAEADARRLFDELMAVTPWRQEIATVMGRRVPIPRLTAWHGEAGYVYSGIRMTPAPWNAPLLEIKAVAEACAGRRSTACCSTSIATGATACRGTPTTSRVSAATR